MVVSIGHQQENQLSLFLCCLRLPFFGGFNWTPTGKPTLFVFVLFEATLLWWFQLDTNRKTNSLCFCVV